MGEACTSKLKPWSDNCSVHQRTLLIYGQIADPAQQAVDGQVIISTHQDILPAVSWPVCDSHFKAIVQLQPGANRLKLELISPRLPAQNGVASTHISWFHLNYLPVLSAPPLDLVILLGKDSPGHFRCSP
ncbi:hypothetical protein MRB53_040383 [Persea americana]|nr:hypothetical protein MRB53_040383 [Persea americana]